MVKHADTENCQSADEFERFFIMVGVAKGKQNYLKHQNLSETLCCS